MSDEPGTPPTEEPGQEPVIPEPPESPTLPPETPTGEPPAEPMTPEEKRDHDMKSWIGRRDADIKQEMERRDQALLEKIATILPQQAPGVPAEPAEAPDPSEDANAWLEHKLQEKMSAETNYNNTLIQTGTAIVQQDELVKVDPTLAQEIYDEAQSGRIQVNRALSAEVAAAMVVATAKNNVLTRRLLNKPNPLARNQPATAPLGSVVPPAAPAAPVVKKPKLSPLASQAAKRWGFSDEEVAETLKDETST